MAVQNRKGRLDQEDNVEFVEFQLGMGARLSRKGCEPYNRLGHNDGVATR
jgi:hypothetical protein